MIRFQQIVLTCAFLAAALPTSSKKLTDMKRRLGSMLTAKYQHADLDTNYVVRPQLCAETVGWLLDAGRVGTGTAWRDTDGGTP